MILKFFTHSSLLHEFKKDKRSGIRGTVVNKAPLRVQYLPALGGRGWERGKAEASSSALLSGEGGVYRESAKV